MTSGLKTKSTLGEKRLTPSTYRRVVVTFPIEVLFCLKAAWDTIYVPFYTAH